MHRRGGGQAIVPKSQEKGEEKEKGPGVRPTISEGKRRNDPRNDFSDDSWISRESVGNEGGTALSESWHGKAAQGRGVEKATD